MSDRTHFPSHAGPRARAGRVALALIVLLAAQGCAVPGVPPVVAECSTPMSTSRPGPALVGQPYGMAMTPVPLNSVQFSSQEVARALAVQDLRAERLSPETVRVSLRAVSCADQPASVRMRTSFMRADTAASEAPTAWKTVHLPPRAMALYTETSTNGDADAYLVEIAR